MSRRLAIGVGLVALAALGGGLWSHHGLAVWLDAAIAFCM